MEKQNILSALLPLAAIFLSTAAHGQVGINNNAPKSTMDVRVINLLLKNCEYKKLKNYIYTILEKAVGKRQRRS